MKCHFMRDEQDVNNKSLPPTPTPSPQKVGGTDMLEKDYNFYMTYSCIYRRFEIIIEYIKYMHRVYRKYGRISIFFVNPDSIRNE
jgi:hypothetical protein